MNIIRFFILLICFAVSSYGSIKFIVVGDTHYYSPSPNFKESILYEITLAAIQKKVDFVFFTGDLVLMNYPNESNYDSLITDWKFVLDTLYSNGIKAYACRGNNDVNSYDTWTKLFSGKYSFPADGPEKEMFYTYSFEYDDFLFISLDQYTEYNKINQEWLDQKLKTNTKPVVFVASHEPAFKVFHYGLSSYPNERNKFWTSLSDNSCKIYFCGHDHFYDHAILQDSDGNPYNDVHQIIVGTGGGGLHPVSDYNGDNGKWQPFRVYHDSSLGYVLVEVDNSHLKTTWKHRIGQFNFVDGGDNYNYIITSVKSKSKNLDGFSLSQNYPNPFNPKTRIFFTVGKSKFGIERQLVSLEIYNVLGKKITTLVDEYKPRGRYEIEFSVNKLPNDLKVLPSGVYFYCLKAGSFYAVRKMIFLK